ncbi:glycoside hydrolase family 26 protein [Streptacidiphilus cavernicola]|uniref:Glycoside hydrolase family 26 protein n=1 Tax=Streptacidiphilus cavernicola TaxID=3342716 RepID=A0ABV6VUB6_9ACTN
MPRRLAHRQGAAGLGWLLGLVLLCVAGCSSQGVVTPLAPWPPQPSTSPAPGVTVPPSAIPTGSTDPGSLRRRLIHPDGDYFGVSTWKAPSESETDLVAGPAGATPTIQEFFVGWDESFNPQSVRNSYHLGALPLLTWEPEGPSKASNQPAYSLSRIAGGAFDGYIKAFAAAVKAEGQPVVIRFAHEMNGSWYPWSEGNSGNRPGDYVKAWRHVHDLFARAGATNVIWLWSPNIVRGSETTGFASLYPGADYVDWVGLDAYALGEKTAGAVLDHSLALLHAITDKPVLISETAAEPGPEKAPWTADLFRWLKLHQDVIGFVWFEHTPTDGGKYDYRFTADPATERAFRKGLASLHLVHWPITAAVSTPPPAPTR